MSQYKIDGLRFRMQTTNKVWSTHPDMSMISLSNVHLRVLDTKLNKDCLVMVPDGPNLIEHHFANIKALRKKYRVVIFDLPGFGFSTHNGLYKYSFADTNNIFLELFDLLNINRVNFVLPCANGFYSLAFANKFPEKVNSLILLQTPGLNAMHSWSDNVIPNYLKKPYLSQLLMPFVENKFANTWYDYALPKDVSKEVYKNIAVKGIKDGANFCLCSLTQGLLSEKGNEKALVVDSTIPTTLIYGDNDFTHKRTDFRSMLKYNKETDIIKFESCGHFPDLERTGQFLQILKDKIH